MTTSTLEAVDPSVGLALALDEFEETLQEFAFVDEEEKQNTIGAYENTSQSLLDSFLKVLSQQVGIRKEGVLRLVDLFNLLRPGISQPKASRLNGIPSTLFGVLKATIIAGHSASGDSALITAKFDRLSQRTTAITGGEAKILPEEVFQALLAQLASCVVEDCSNILRLRSRSAFQAFQPAVDRIDQICRDLEKETAKARKAAWQKEQADEQKRAADEEKVHKVEAWIEDIVRENAPDKHDDYTSSRVAGTGAAFISKIQEWLQAKEAPIFLAHGSPGVGKTFLACAVVSQHFEKPFQGVDLAYTYFSYDDRDQQTPFVVYAGIITQLLRHSSQLRQDVFRLFDENKNLARKHRFQIFKGFRRAVFGLKSTNLLVFDALDEASEKTRVEILSLLKSAHSDSPRILVTSRSDFRESLGHEQVLSHHVRADDHDILAFSEDRLKNENVKRIVQAHCKTATEAQRFTSKLSEEILTNSHGFFLHAYYAAEDVCGQVNISGITNAASKRHHSANKIYAATLERINILAEPQKDLAYRTIAWLTFTKKPFEENELKEAFEISNVNGQVDPGTQIIVENVLEYCRGLVVRTKSRKVSYLRLAHMTAQEYFSQVSVFQHYQADMCLTCFNRVISCLIPNTMVDQQQDSLGDPNVNVYKEHYDLDDATDEDTSDSCSNEEFEKLDSPDATKREDEISVADDENGSDDGTDVSLSEDADSLTIFEDHQYWRISGDVWSQNLLPWITKKTPFSLYAGRHALSHLTESTMTPEIEKTVLKFIKTAISRRRRSTFSSKLQDHPYGMKMLHMASFIGITSAFQAVLGMPMTHVDDRDALGRTPLMWALGLVKETVAEKLLDEGAQVRAYDRREHSTLMYASMIKDEALLTRLLQRSPDSDMTASLLVSCAKANNVFLLNGALSRANVDINQFDKNGRTPLHEAVISGSEAVVHSLIRSPIIQLSAVDSAGRTPLMYAADGQNVVIVKSLIRAGAKSDTLSQSGESSLHVAAKNAEGSQMMLRLLLRSGPNTLVEDKNGLVPLQTLLRICQDQYRSEKELLACVKLLSDNADTVSHQSHDGANALHDAVQCQYISVLRYLIGRAPPNAINAQKKSGQTPIFEAVMAGNIRAFDLLIDLPGIDLLATRNDKKTLLNCAAWADEIDIARKLIDKEPQLIKLAEEHGIPAIHYAVERDNASMFQLLLEAGSDPRSRRHTLSTPNQDLISYAAFYGRVWCLDTLLRLKAWMIYDPVGQLVAHKDDQGKNLLHEAAASVSPTVLQKILNLLPLEGLTLESRDVSGRTPLHYAARERKEIPVSLLLTAGSDKDALTMDGNTPLDLALASEAVDVVRILVLADGHVGQASCLSSSDIQRYEREDFFAKLKDIIAVPLRSQRDDVRTDAQWFEKKVHRVGTEYDVFNEWSPDIPFLEIIVPETAALPCEQVIFETDSHDQGWSGNSVEWGGTYHQSYTFFDAAVQNVWTSVGSTEHRPSPRIRVQTNVHAVAKFRTHINVFDCAGSDRERREWTQALRRGDRIQLYAKAMYSGWLNYVQKVEITLRYREVIPSEGTGDASVKGLPEEAERLRACEQDPQGDASSLQPKLVIYHRSLLAESGVPTSLRPLVREDTGITAVILGNFYLRQHQRVRDMEAQEPKANGNFSMFLNEYALEDPNTEAIWADVEYLQTKGVKVIGMLSMYGDVDEGKNEQSSLGSCDDFIFERSYKALHDLVVSRKLDGFNLDTERRGNKTTAEEDGISLHVLIRLLDRLHADFGPNFIIVMTASAEALLSTNTDQTNPSIDYGTLEIQKGHLISWYNVRIFTPRERSGDQAHETRLPRSFKGWRVEDGPDERRDPATDLVRELNSYIRLLQRNIYRNDRLLMAVSTSPNACSATLGDHGPYIDPPHLRSLLELLRWSYGPMDFGGIAGWEYSSARGSMIAGDAGVSRSPWLWAKETRAILESVFPSPQSRSE